MKTLMLICAFIAFALSGTAYAEGVSAEDIECGNNPPCLHSPEGKEPGIIS